MRMNFLQDIELPQPLPEQDSRRRKQLLMLSLLLMGWANCALADQVIWTGQADSNWHNDNNWAPSLFPDEDVSVVIDTTNPNAPVINSLNTGPIKALDIGLTDMATLEIINAGQLSTNDRVHLGENEGASGEINVHGPGSRFESAATIGRITAIGVEGTGKLTITDGASVTSENTSSNVIVAFVALEDDSVGEVVVTGAGSNWEIFSASGFGQMIVGQRGQGTMTISDGGSVTSRGATVGRFAAAVGSVSVSGTGSLWASTADPNTTQNEGGIAIGGGAQGELTVMDGGRVESTFGVLGSGNSGTGSATISGSGSEWKIDGLLRIGQEGEGILLVEEGARVSADEVLFAWNVGSNTGTGLATISGAGSAMDISGSVVVGAGQDSTLVRGGTGHLEVLAGGHVTASSAMLGQVERAEGYITIGDKGSTIEIDGDLAIGQDGYGEIRIEQGGYLDNANTLVGAGNFPSDGNGRVIVTDAGSLWENRGNLFVLRGYLGVSQGGTVSVLGAFESGNTSGMGTVIVIGAGFDDDDDLLAPVAPGHLVSDDLQIGNHGRLVFNHDASSYAFIPPLRGRGLIEVHAGTTEMPGDSMAFDGTTEVFAGTLQIDQALGGKINVYSDGTLRGAGSVGDATVAGRLEPGNTIGTLTTANLDLDPEAILAFELGEPGVTGSNVNDLIMVEGDLVLDGQLEVNAVSGFEAGTFTLLTYSGSLDDNGLQVNHLPAGFNGQIDSSVAGEVRLIVDGQDTDTVFTDRFEP
jgi:T5SS/PEP-CTERM-associated repeat protein